MARRHLPLTDDAGKVIGHITVDVKNPSAKCDFCFTGNAKVHTKLCDFPIHKGKDAKKYTCSLRLCDDCATSGDRDRKAGVDFCPVHAVLVEKNGLGARLVPLLAQDDLEAHKVALDLVDVMMIETAAPRPKINPPVDRTITDGWPSRRMLWLEYFNERAAIYEYLGELPRFEAELRAQADAGPRPRPP